jgi:DNA-binding transcriptional regulator/RsmH inhibitor MraZ
LRDFAGLKLMRRAVLVNRECAAHGRFQIWNRASYSAALAEAEAALLRLDARLEARWPDL